MLSALVAVMRGFHRSLVDLHKKGSVMQPFYLLLFWTSRFMLKWHHCKPKIHDNSKKTCRLIKTIFLINGDLFEIITGHTVYPKKYAHGFCFAVLCCGYTLTDFPISIRLTSLALWQSNDCPSASKATLMNMDKYFMWIHYERLHNHNKAKHNKTVCIFLGIYCRSCKGAMCNFAVSTVLAYGSSLLDPRTHKGQWWPALGISQAASN